VQKWNTFSGSALKKLGSSRLDCSKASSSGARLHNVAGNPLGEFSPYTGVREALIQQIHTGVVPDVAHCSSNALVHRLDAQILVELVAGAGTQPLVQVPHSLLQLRRLAVGIWQTHHQNSGENKNR